MQAAQIIFILVATAVFAGCTSFQQYSYRDYGVRELQLDSESASVKLRKAIEKTRAGDTITGFVDSTCFDVPMFTDKADGCRQQRNSTIAVLLQASDDMCQEHLKTIFGNDASFNIVTGSIATLFSGAAAIAGGTSAKSALAAVSTFANAERSLVNEVVYKNMIVTAVTKKIREARSTKAAAMIPGNFKKPMDDYPMVAALHDVMDYHYTCSFMFGLEKALEEGTQSGTDAKAARLELEKRSLELSIDSRRATLKGQKMTDKQIEDDPGIKGAIKRVTEIEAQLLALVRGTSQAASAAAQTPSDTGKPEPPAGTKPGADGKPAAEAKPAAQ